MKTQKVRSDILSKCEANYDINSSSVLNKKHNANIFLNYFKGTLLILWRSVFGKTIKKCKFMARSRDHVLYLLLLSFIIGSVQSQAGENGIPIKL